MTIDKGIHLGNDLLKTLMRVAALYPAYMVCRVVFYLYNRELLGTIASDELGGLLKGAFVFDSASIALTSVLFVLLALAPLPCKDRQGYRRTMAWCYMLINGFGFACLIGDVLYFPFKMRRGAADDLHYLSEGNVGEIVGYGMVQHLWIFVLFAALMSWLWWVFKRSERIVATRYVGFKPYLTYSGALLAAAGLIVIGIRGGFTSVFPINIPDATLYATPRKAALVLSNPFCLYRSISETVKLPSYMPQQEALEIFSPWHDGSDTTHDSEMATHPALPHNSNIIIFILESFGSGFSALHTGSTVESDNAMPFLDSLQHHGLSYRMTFQSGFRSMDAMPSIWASIPSYKIQLLTQPQSASFYQGLPTILSEAGYTTAFFHGNFHQTMSFYPFGTMTGIKDFYMREEYSKERDAGDAMGTWGIHDHEMLDYMGEKLDMMREPFFASIFTLSSHHPYDIPERYTAQWSHFANPTNRTIRYTDNEMRRFFAQHKGKEWFKRSLFVFVADHSERSDVDLFLTPPRNHLVPLLFYRPDDSLSHIDSLPAQQIDIMPTMLGLLGYHGDYFAFGNDLRQTPDEKRRAVYYNFSTQQYSLVTPSRLYLFDGQNIVGAYDYLADKTCNRNLLEQGETIPPALLHWFKAYLQVYGSQVTHSNFLSAQP